MNFWYMIRALPGRCSGGDFLNRSSWVIKWAYWTLNCFPKKVMKVSFMVVLARTSSNVVNWILLDPSSPELCPYVVLARMEESTWWEELSSMLGVWNDITTGMITEKVNDDSLANVKIRKKNSGLFCDTMASSNEAINQEIATPSDVSLGARILPMISFFRNKLSSTFLIIIQNMINVIINNHTIAPTMMSVAIVGPSFTTKGTPKLSKTVTMIPVVIKYDLTNLFLLLNSWWL